MTKNNEKSRLHKEKTDNTDVEYSKELADVEDREAVDRAKAAAQRVNKENI
ncbi:YfhD family protein [Salipaludibacillus daqingensis]|uniref:YfhD family protein n=1 Tax=Salipaludibacillus daqingensis TaxID=3041001 RepID=UPI0024742C52|nr:YfhD family protein [Salipaludibacillus daqingensis]